MDTKRTLLFMRHAQAKSSHDGIDDLGRELKDKGKRNAQRIGVWLAQNEIKPDLVLTSPAVRACVTAEKTLKAANLSPDIIVEKKNFYNAVPRDILTQIKKLLLRQKTVMIVGHNPSLEIVMAELVNGHIPKTKNGRYLTRGALAHLELDCKWQDIQPNCATLKEIVYPKKLDAYFPFPDAKGKEKRIRPAYYYNQSCVVPYRINDGSPEILIITSSKNKHWVLPKGIHEPGLSAQESAAQEAWEEAGVRGIVEQEALGRFCYEKWEAECEVSVYPMQVQDVMDAGIWEENHRMRKWCSLDQAINLLENEDLAAMVARLPHHIKGIAQ